MTTKPQSTTTPKRTRSAAAARWCRIATLTALTALVAASPALAGTETKFTISGKGWGHGIGLSQWGAYGFAKHGWKYDRILARYYKGTSLKRMSFAPMRVLLKSGLTSAKVTYSTQYTASGGGKSMTIPANTVAVTTYARNLYTVTAGSKKETFSSAVTFKSPKNIMNVRTPSDMNVVGLYHGTITVALYNGKLAIVNTVPMENFTCSNISHEVSGSWPAEAIKAQACAARSYAARVAMGAPKGRIFDVYCDTRRAQTYTGIGHEHPAINAAVRATAGIGPVYNGAPISAFYFASSGGYTENIEYGWWPGGSPIPYLKGVRDPYDTYASRHTWGPFTFTQRAATASLGGDVRGDLRAITTVRRGVSPRTVQAAVVGSKGTTLIGGNALRVKLGLYSTWLSIRSMAISPAAGDKKRVTPGTKVTLSGRTYPGIATGGIVTLNSYYNGAWHTQRVTTTRSSTPLPGGKSASFSSYKATVTVRSTTRYYWSYGATTSPSTTITTTR